MASARLPADIPLKIRNPARSASALTSGVAYEAIPSKPAALIAAICFFRGQVRPAEGHPIIDQGVAHWIRRGALGRDFMT